VVAPLVWLLVNPADWAPYLRSSCGRPEAPCELEASGMSPRPCCSSAGSVRSSPTVQC
jgi:hypothetical protein